MKIIDELTIHTDGGSRGNPGPAAIGVVMSVGDSKEQLAQFGKQIGEATNNTAEYMAVLEAFNYLQSREVKAKKISVYMDSQVVARQLSGAYKIKKSHLLALHTQVKALENLVGEEITYFSIPRAENAEADLLLNAALDGKTQ